MSFLNSSHPSQVTHQCHYLSLSQFAVLYLDWVFAWGHPYGGHGIMKQGVFKVYPVSSPQAPFQNFPFLTVQLCDWLSQLPKLKCLIIIKHHWLCWIFCIPITFMGWLLCNVESAHKSSFQSDAIYLTPVQQTLVESYGSVTLSHISESELGLRMAPTHPKICQVSFSFPNSGVFWVASVCQGEVFGALS